MSGWRVPRRRWTGHAARGALLVAASSCSTLADPPVTEECRSDAECEEGLVCAIDQGRCLPGNEAAPRAHLGFDIRERRFRVEVDGCDCTIDEEENIRELALRRSRVSQLFLLEVTGEASDPDSIEVLPARLELSQPTRYGAFPSPMTGSIFNFEDRPDEGTSVAVEAILRWPRYHPLDRNVPPELVLWQVDPRSDTGLAPRYLGVLPPRTDAAKPCTVDSDCCEPKGDCNPAPNFCDLEVGECTAVGQPTWRYGYDYTENCSREFAGKVVRLNMETYTVGPALGNASVRLRYADWPTEPFGIPPLGDLPAAERPPECSDDSECDTPDEYCDPTTRQCFVALGGRFADRSAATTSDDPAFRGVFQTFVYTYCEGYDPNVPLDRPFALTVKPPVHLPLPTVEYEVEATFNPWPQGESDFRLGRGLCVPDWGEAGAALQISLAGQPRTLVDGDQEYTCCDLGCLPTSAEDAEAGPPPAPTRCDGRTSGGALPTIRLEAPFVLDEEAKDAADCVLPRVDAEGRAGSLELTGTCSSTPGAPCTVEPLALGTAQTPRRYEVRVETEVGSMLASGDFVIEVGPEPPELETLTLAPRVLVTGVVDVDQVICGRRDPGEDCAAREAVVMAERLRMPDEPDGSVPGPYFHAVSTFYDPVAKRDGAFVLPLDPGGVYVVTAVPAAGAEGGPAGYTLVDLRADAPTPLEPLRLVLEDGVVVTLRLEQFESRTTVTPMDRGSYLVPGRTLQLEPTAPPIDLNEIGVCWSSADGQAPGCQIRRLIAPGSDLARSQVGVVRFTARRSDQAECPTRCPMQPPSE